MKLKNLTFAVVLFITIASGSLPGFSLEVEAEEASSMYSHTEISIEVNSPDTLKQIKKQVIRDVIQTDAELSLDSIDLDGSEITFDQLDITKVSTQKVNLFINLKQKSDRTTLVQSTISRTYLINIVDTVAPELILTHDVVQIQFGREFDSTSYIKTVIDNSGIDYSNQVIINDTVDTSSPGDYVVSYRVYDDSKNESEQLLHVQVKYNINASGGVSSGEKITDMLALINEARASYNLSPLNLADEAGQRAIAIRAQESHGDVSHKRPDGSHYKTALTEQGVTWANSPLEILTYAGSTVEAKLNWWMGSAGHRSILLQPDYETIAIGYSGEMWAAILY